MGNDCCCGAETGFNNIKENKVVKINENDYLEEIIEYKETNSPKPTFENNEKNKKEIHPDPPEDFTFTNRDKNGVNTNNPEKANNIDNGGEFPSTEKREMDTQTPHKENLNNNNNLIKNNNNIFNNNNLMNNINNNFNNINFKNFNNNNFINNNFNNFNNNNLMNNINNNFNNFNNNNLMNNINNNFNNNNLMNNNNNNKNNNNNFIEFNRPKPISFYSKPTLIGLQNIGATCFMNSILQCLSQTKDLTNYFLDEQHWDEINNNNIALRDKNELQLTPAYLQLLINLWGKNNQIKYYEPRNFMNIVENMNPLFKLGQAGDSKDFIIFLLEQFHNELKKSLINNNSENNSDQVNQYDQKETLSSFFKDFQKQTSIISDIFFGIEENTSICLYCQNNFGSQGKNFPILYNYQIFNVLIFDLNDVRKMRNPNIWPNTNEVSLEDCFDYNQRTVCYTGNNRLYCKICQQKWDSNSTSKIYSCPNVLVLVLHRGKNNMFNVKLNFEETINITKYVSLKEGQVIYNLVGVVTHLGESGPNAHFIAFCKSPINLKWYKYNDAFVNPVENVKKDIIDFGNPYILFYKKVNG